MKPVQHFSDDYLAKCRDASPDEVLAFLEEFRLMQAPGDRSRSISLRVPESLLAGFRSRCDIEGVAYQTRIKELMRRWLEGAE